MQPFEAQTCDIPTVRNVIGASRLWMNPCLALSTGYLRPLMINAIMLLLFTSLPVILEDTLVCVCKLAIPVKLSVYLSVI